MRAPFTDLYVHLVWTTWDRLPLITPAVKEPLAAAILAKCRQLGAVPIAIGLMPDHAHVLVKLPPTLPVSDLAKEVKGASSHLVNHLPQRDAAFKWQGAYGAFTLARDGVPAVKEYIGNQERHHGGGSVVEGWERGFTWVEPGMTAGN